MGKGVGLPVKEVIPTIEGVWFPVGEEIAGCELRLEEGKWVRFAARKFRGPELRQKVRGLEGWGEEKMYREGWN
jgi:hypothetical protein